MVPTATVKMAKWATKNIRLADVLTSIAYLGWRQERSGEGRETLERGQRVRRMVVLLTVVVLMVAMMALTAMPAVAKGTRGAQGLVGVHVGQTSVSLDGLASVSLGPIDLNVL